MTLPAQKNSWALAAQSIIKNFQKRSIDAYYCPDRESARAKVQELLKKGSTVTCGGSETLKRNRNHGSSHGWVLSFSRPQIPGCHLRTDRGGRLLSLQYQRFYHRW